MTRRFFDQVDDEVRGFVGPDLRNFQSVKNSRLMKLWYGDPAVHFEAQLLSPTWAPRRQLCLEVGLHMESKERSRNERILNELIGCREAWGERLDGAEHGEAFGPQGPAWRRLSEVCVVEAMDEEFAGEIAERFAAYIVTLQPILNEL